MNIKKYKSHGTGEYRVCDFKNIGHDVVWESGILVFHPESISIGENVYIGHNTILKGYYKNEMIIGNNTWIGQNCFLHSAGGVYIGDSVGIGPYVKIITSSHKDDDNAIPVLFNDIEFDKVVIGDGADIGIGSTILPGNQIGAGAIIGAGSVVTKDIPPYSIAAGAPARILRYRNEHR